MNLFDTYVDDGLNFISKKCTQAIPQVCFRFILGFHVTSTVNEAQFIK